MAGLRKATKTLRRVSQCPVRILSEYKSEALPVEPSYSSVVQVVTSNKDSNFEMLYSVDW
jgi:hypothetical protein